MPIVSVGRDKLFDALGRTYSEFSFAVDVCIKWALCLVLHPDVSHCPRAAEEEFQALCFEYGIELDDVVRRWNCPCVPGAAEAQTLPMHAGHGRHHCLLAQALHGRRLTLNPNHRHCHTL